MSEEFLQHIFEPFSQEQADARSVYHGTGLGMSIVKKLVDKMGGMISVTSEIGKGSTFVIELPFEIASAPEKAKKEETDKKNGENIFEDMEMPVIEDQKSDNKEDLSFWPEEEKIVDNVDAGEISLDEQINNLLSNNNTLVKKKVA